MMMVRYSEKIITLWAVFLLGTLFHTQLGLMPLFHNQSVAIEHASGTGSIAWVLWSMLGFFVVPMILMIGTLFDHSKWYRKVHFSVTVFYSVMNFAHVVADLVIPPIAWYQVTLMIFLFSIGLLLNVVSWQWLQARTQYQPAQHSCDREIYSGFPSDKPQ